MSGRCRHALVALVDGKFVGGGMGSGCKLVTIGNWIVLLLSRYFLMAA